MVAEEKEKNSSNSTSTRGKKSINTNSTSASSVSVKSDVSGKSENLKVSGNDSTANTVISSDETLSMDSKMTDITNDTNSNNKNSNNNNNNDDNNPSDYITKNKESYQKMKTDETEKVLNRATADWLCDNCNAQNFAKLLSGVERTKCFKCQYVRGSNCSLVLSVAEVNSYFSSFLSLCIWRSILTLQTSKFNNVIFFGFFEFSTSFFFIHNCSSFFVHFIFHDFFFFL